MNDPTKNPDPASAEASEAAVRALVEEIGDAWGRGDADAYARLFAEDADYVVFDGTHLKGRAAIAASHRPLFEKFMKGSRLAWLGVDVRFPAPDVALIHGKGAILMAGQEAPAKRRVSVQTLVAARRGGAWELVAFQNTRYRPFAESLLGRILTRLAPRGPWAPAPSGALPAPAPPQ